mgnify:CR=1 FL=1
MRASLGIVTHTNDVDNVGILASWHANQKIVWLDVAVYQGFLVDCLYPGNLRRSIKGG